MVFTKDGKTNFLYNIHTDNIFLLFINSASFHRSWRISDHFVLSYLTHIYLRFSVCLCVCVSVPPPGTRLSWPKASENRVIYKYNILLRNHHLLLRHQNIILKYHKLEGTAVYGRLLLAHAEGWWPSATWRALRALLIPPPPTR